MKKAKVIIKTNDPKEAEYLAKILINDAQERKLSVACTKLFNGLFGTDYKKEVKISTEKEHGLQRSKKARNDP
jgi:hypothetical protein